MYYVYIIRCSDDTLYTGITTDVNRRIAEHNGEGNVGAKYTRARRPVRLVYSAEFENRSYATKEEVRIKSLSRNGKESVVEGDKK